MAKKVFLAAPTLGDLAAALGRLLAERPEAAGWAWNGFDDACLYAAADDLWTDVVCFDPRPDLPRAAAGRR